jgi:hypothetical protein
LTFEARSWSGFCEAMVEAELDALLLLLLWAVVLGFGASAFKASEELDDELAPVVLDFEASDFIGSPRFDLESDFIESLDDGEAAGGELGLEGEGDCAKAAVANTPLSAVVTNNFFNIVEPPCK